jgi:hypothetical protein
MLKIQEKPEVGGKTLKKLMVLAAMLALVLAVAAPAMAQEVKNGVGNEGESGDASLSFSVISSGNNSNQCVTPLQFANTGNLNNGQAMLQYASQTAGPLGNLEAEGPTFSFTPELTAPCTQQVQQSSAASSN